jgi:hypothetical protein
MCEDHSHATAKRIERRALDVLQEADEMGGPSVRDYIGLMQRMADVCRLRAETARQLLPEIAVLHWARREIHPDTMLVDTGGGCTALEVPVPSRRPDGPADYWWITDDASAPETLGDVDGEGLCLGFYNGNSDGTQWVCFNVRSMQVARDLIKGFAGVCWGDE